MDIQKLRHQTAVCIACSMNNTPALNPDGSLKDASEIKFIHSPSHENITLPTATASPPIANAFSFMQPMGPQHAASLLGKKRPLLDNDAASSGNVTKQHASTISKESWKRNNETSGTAKAKPKKPAAIDWLLSHSSINSAPSSWSTSVAASELSNEGGNDSGCEKKCHRKTDGPADVLTIFELVDPDDPDEGYRCSGCV